MTIRATKCMWKDKKGWIPRVCGSISACEMGLIVGIDKNTQHLYTKRRSMGDEVCELVLRRSMSLDSQSGHEEQVRQRILILEIFQAFT